MYVRVLAPNLGFSGQTRGRITMSMLGRLECICDDCVLFNFSSENFGNSGEKSPEFPKSGIRVPGTRMPLYCSLCMKTRLMIGTTYEN